jgi:hypothetical protein
MNLDKKLFKFGILYMKGSNISKGISLPFLLED